MEFLSFWKITWNFSESKVHIILGVLKLTDKGWQEIPTPIITYTIFTNSFRWGAGDNPVSVQKHIIEVQLIDFVFEYLIFVGVKR